MLAVARTGAAGELRVVQASRGVGAEREMKIRRSGHGALAPLLVAAAICSGCFGPVADLEERYTAKETPPASVAKGPKVVLLSPDHRGAFTIHGVRQAFTDSGVYLKVAPVGLSKELWIPLEALAGCSRTQWGAGRWDTNLWVQDARVLISFPDNDDRLVQWCRDRGITVYDRATESRWLNER